MTAMSGDPPLSSDAFRHVPTLRDRVAAPDTSALRVTLQTLQVWDERARQDGRPHDWRLSETELQASRQAMLAQREGADELWIYSYGSLMWDPGFHFAEVRRADLQGHQRRFSFQTTLGRGSPGQPGLMLALEPGAGCCQGLVFRVDPSLVDVESAIVWRREMIRGSYRPAWVPVDTPQGTVTALAFGANRSHRDYVGELPLDQTARMIAWASGFLGKNRAYLEQLAEQLGRLQIHDPYVLHLMEQVRGTG